MKSFVKRWLGDGGPTAATGAPAVAPAVPPGRRVYVIGDIHGRLDLLRLGAAGYPAPEFVVELYAMG